uniref:Uncharacterized protein n=1 Tax=Strigamia maritima TaxID=126957 RepID=T1JPA1_STRMM
MKLRWRYNLMIQSEALISSTDIDNYSIVAFSSIGFNLHMRFPLFSVWKLLLWVVFVDCIAVGIVIATIFWFVLNHYFRKPTCIDQDVEWGYAFDVHLNAFFPLLVILHVIQVIFFDIFSNNSWFFGIFVGNSFWLIAIGYYIYITFLGYSALPILKQTHLLLYPMVLLFIFYVISLFSYLNLCEDLSIFYGARMA